jgi:hypothetical protein
MGKRSDFKRNHHDLYATPHRPVTYLLPFIRDISCYVEPCCGNCDLIHHLTCYGKTCTWASDIQKGIDALELDADAFFYAEAIITNPPWTFSLMDPLLRHFLKFRPVWFLLSGDYAFNEQSGWSMERCTDIVAVPRVKWISGSKWDAKDNCAWYRFQADHRGGARFHARRQQPDLLEVAA